MHPGPGWFVGGERLASKSDRWVAIGCGFILEHHDSEISIGSGVPRGDKVKTARGCRWMGPHKAFPVWDRIEYEMQVKGQHLIGLVIMLAEVCTSHMSAVAGHAR